MSLASLGFSDSLSKQLFIKQRLLKNVSEAQLAYLDKRTDEKMFNSTFTILEMLAEIKEGTILPFTSSDEGRATLTSLVQGTRLALNLTLELRKVTQPMNHEQLAYHGQWVTLGKAFASQLMTLQNGLKKADDQTASTLALYIEVGVAVMILVVICISILQLKLYVSVHAIENQIYTLHTTIDGQVLREWMVAKVDKKAEQGFGIQGDSKWKKEKLLRSNSQADRAERGIQRKSRSIKNIPLPKGRIAIWSLLLMTSFSLYATMIYYGLTLSKNVSDDYGDLIQSNANILWGYVEADNLALGLVLFEITGTPISTGDLTSRRDFDQKLREIRVFENELQDRLYSEEFSSYHLNQSSNLCQIFSSDPIDKFQCGNVSSGIIKKGK
jgi:hypothetical protein